MSKPSDTITIVNAPHIGIQLRNESGLSGPETLTVGTLDALTELREQIDQYLQKRGQVEYIKSIHAIRLAAEEGYTLSAHTLNVACDRGNIANAKKLRGRWHMPKPEFERWYAEWKLKKDRQAESEEADNQENK